MGSPDYFVFTGGIGEDLAARSELADRLPLGIEVIYEPVDSTKNDYAQRRTDVGLTVVELAKHGRVSVAGDSFGGQFILGVFADHPGSVRRAVTYSTKMAGFDLPERVFQRHPNMKHVSNAVEADVKKIRNNPDMLGRMLCVTSLGDDEIDDLSLLVLEGASTHTTNAWTHRSAIERALTSDFPVTVDFIL